jgi:soluble lytic murein transglycosylase-like protein
VAAWQVAGLVLVLVTAVAAWALLPTDARLSCEQQALGWLQMRHEARTDALPPAPAASTSPLAALAAPRRASDAMSAKPPSGTASPAASKTAPAEPGVPALDTQQAAVARWISARYRVASEPIARIVHEAWETGRRSGLDPLLILAVMSIESRFNPFAQSPMGAEGLMQVVTRVHSDKFERFGGDHAAFDPISNLRVGVQVLKESIARAGGSLEGGLKAYVGATSISAEGYLRKVMSEREFLRQVKQGIRVPAHVNAMARTSAPSPKTPPEPARDSDEPTEGEPATPTVVASDTRPPGALPAR